VFALLCRLIRIAVGFLVRVTGNSALQQTHFVPAAILASQTFPPAAAAAAASNCWIRSRGAFTTIRAVFPKQNLGASRNPRG